MGFDVGAEVGFSVGSSVGFSVGASVTSVVGVSDSYALHPTSDSAIERTMIILIKIRLVFFIFFSFTVNISKGSALLYHRAKALSITNARI